MALTTNGSRIGRAASIEAREFREYLYEQEEKARRERAAYISDVCDQIRDRLTQAEYDAWWESTDAKGFGAQAEKKLVELKESDVVPPLMQYEIDALKKMQAEFLATSDEYLHQRAASIDKQIESILAHQKVSLPSIEEKDLPADDHWYHDNPNY